MDKQDIQNRLNQEPFHPFIIKLASGRQITIDLDSEVYFPRRHPDRVFVFTEDGLTHEFDTDAVLSIVEQ